MSAKATADEPILETRGLSKHFGGLAAVDGLDLSVREREILAVIGPNGAGKTTLFNLLSGVLRATSGRIALRGRRIDNKAPHVIAALGVARTFQNPQLFEGLTVLDNVMVGRHARTRSGLFEAVLRLPRSRREDRQGREKCLAALARVGLAERADDDALSLPFGQQRRVEIARALVSEPHLVLLDEPAAGLNSRERVGLAEIIGSLPESGMTPLLVDHDMDLVMDISERVAVLNHGRKIAEGPPRQVQTDPAVIEAYLGEEISC